MAADDDGRLLAWQPGDDPDLLVREVKTHLGAYPSGDRTTDDPILAYMADHESAEAEFYDRLRKALAELPDPPFWFRVQFFFGDCAWRIRRLFKP